MIWMILGGILTSLFLLLAATILTVPGGGVGSVVILLASLMMLGAPGLTLIVFSWAGMRRRRRIVKTARSLQAAGAVISADEIMKVVDADEQEVRTILVKKGFIKRDAVPSPFAWHVVCPKCGTWFDQAPRGSILGFRKFACTQCQADVYYPIKDSHRVPLLILAIIVGILSIGPIIGMVAATVNPNLLMFVMPGGGILILYTYFKDRSLRDELARFDSRYRSDLAGPPPGL